MWFVVSPPAWCLNLLPVFGELLTEPALWGARLTSNIRSWENQRSVFQAFLALGCGEVSEAQPLRLTQAQVWTRRRGLREETQTYPHWQQEMGWRTGSRFPGHTSTPAAHRDCVPSPGPEAWETVHPGIRRRTVLPGGFRGLVCDSLFPAAQPALPLPQPKVLLWPSQGTQW